MQVVERIIYMNEVKALLISIAIVAWAFSGYLLLYHSNIELFIIYSLVVVTAYVPHELSHKYVARKYGCYSRFILDPIGSMLTFVSGFLPYIAIIVPGYVFVSIPYYDRESSEKIVGIVSAAGPIVNILYSAIALAIAYSIPPATIQLALARSVAFFASAVNAWIAFFNLIPIPPLDGSKIIRWRKTIWLMMFALSILLLIAARI